MAVPVIQSSFATGEITPSLFGRVDVSREHAAAATMRNLFVSYRGGAYSRAGTSFVGFSKQTGRSVPPRLIPFQFSINQGFALEFGNFYMRLIADGAYVTETPYIITNITKANPAVVTATIQQQAVSATPNDGAVSSSYAPGDTVTLAGGTFSTAAVVKVSSTTLKSISLNSPGQSHPFGSPNPSQSYVPGDSLLLSGGAPSNAVGASVSTTQVINVGLVNSGTGGSNGSQTLTGTTGTGTRLQINVTITGGSISSINSILVAGSYTVNPSNLGNESMGGAGISNAFVNLQMGVLAFSITNSGIFSANPPGGNMTSTDVTTPGASGATFTSAVMAPYAVAVTTPGSYSVIPSNPASQASTSGSGSGVTLTVTWSSANAPSTGDWVYVSNVGGMIQVNNEEFVAASVSVVGSTATFNLTDVYGNNVDSTGFSSYTSGGDAARIYTTASPYAEADLRWIKYTQSADVMSLCCVNQQTGTEYPPQDLVRSGNTSWSFNQVVPTPTATPPAGSVTVAISGGTGTVSYAYVVTSVAADGTESIASAVGTATGGDIASSAGSVTVTWSPVAGIASYNVYKATPDAAGTPPVGVLLGFAGSAYGTQFVDGNIVPDFTQVPPTHQDPFARGQITAVNVTGSTGTVTSVTFTITTATGSGAVLEGVIVSSALVAVIVVDAGSGYSPTDFVTVVVTGGGSATAALVVGAESGTYPSVPAYFQERRAYANTLDNPDTYFMSQPGSFTNFDTRNPTIDSDAITGSPWAQEVNGIQFMLPMPGGLVTLTGLSAWLVNGGGGSALNVQPITPASQQAVPQTYNGCSPLLGPIKIDYDVVYLQSKGSIYRRFNYNIYANIYTGEDITIASAHLFSGHTMVDHAWCEEPYKIMWAVRDDGVMLSSTILKTQEVLGWARHDTVGLFQACCSVTEPPVDALYVAVERFFPLGGAYTVERMDNRLWSQAETSWCVDCGLSLAQSAPAATLTVSSAAGLGACTGVTSPVGGSGYSGGTTATIVDFDPFGEPGPGSGAVASLTISGGVITGVTISPQGTGYLNPAISFLDPAGSAGGVGASATVTLSSTATFAASAGVFSSGNVGSVIRSGGGIAVITAFTDSQHVTANILSPITEVVPGTATPAPQAAGSWTMTAPTTTILGLRHLSGVTVTGLADGNVVSGLVVSSSGQVTLSTAASAVTLGIGFTAQLQSVYLDAGEPTVQGQRKKVAAVTARIEASRGLSIGSNQADASTQSPPDVFVTWGGMTTVPDDGPNFPKKPPNALCTPLRTGDQRIPVSGGYNTRGQVAIQQVNPLPMQVLAFVPEVMAGDVPQTAVPKRQPG